MADYTINIFLDADKKAKLEAAEMDGSIVEVDGKEAVVVPVTKKEQKKLAKGFDDLAVSADNVITLPDEAADKLFGFVCDMKTNDVMKFAIMKLYNPLAGKAPRSAQR